MKLPDRECVVCKAILKPIYKVVGEPMIGGSNPATISHYICPSCKLRYE